MEANLYEVLERIAIALEQNNRLMENQELRQRKLDRLDADHKKQQIKESKVIKTRPQIKKG